MGTTNGIEVSPDEQTLYVNESVQQNVWKYDIQHDGSVKNKTLLINFDTLGMDGMRCDNQGNLYIARYGKGTVAIVKPNGELLGEIELIGKKPTNVAFGGDDGKTLYITLQDTRKVEYCRVPFPGRTFQN
jgi:sugar lactone lactonase YvrE